MSEADLILLLFACLACACLGAWMGFDAGYDKAWWDRTRDFTERALDKAEQEGAS